jgi:outer membrane protein
MRQHLFHALVLGLVLPRASVAQPSEAGNAGAVPVACLSVARAFADSAEGKAAQQTLAELRQRRSTEIDVRNLQLKELQRALEENGASLDEATRQEREREMARIEVDLERMLEDARAEVVEKEKELAAAFQGKLPPIVAALAKEKGLLLVLDRDAAGIVWGAPALDITAEVVRRLNQSSTPGATSPSPRR